MPLATDPARIDGCREMGAEVILCDDIEHAFGIMEQSVILEGLSKIHPYEGHHMTMGAATCGAEFVAQHPDLEIIIVPVGGGGLIGGIAAAAKLANPNIQVIGVEPVGADAMHRSLALGKPVHINNAVSIADSLAAPTTLPYSFGIAKTYVDRIVRIEEDALRTAMVMYHNVLGLTVEPACAAALAGLIGPLKDAAAGKMWASSPAGPISGSHDTWTFCDFRNLPNVEQRERHHACNYFEDRTIEPPIEVTARRLTLRR